MSFLYTTKFGGHHHSRRYATLAERFWSCVQKSFDGCWEWTGSKNPQGRGIICATRYGKQVMLCAPRVSFEMHFFPPPPDRGVLHKCDNPGCVRPSHLFLGTAADNTADMVRKDRHYRGSRHYLARLDEQKVSAIRRALRDGLRRRELASAFEVSLGVIDGIIHGRSWRHVT